MKKHKGWQSTRKIDKSIIEKYDLNILFEEEFYRYIDVVEDLYASITEYRSIKTKTLFMDLKIPLLIHCLDYHIGETLKDKKIIDKNLKSNLFKIINKETKFWIVKFLRKGKALDLFNAFSIGGYDLFKKLEL